MTESTRIALLVRRGRARRRAGPWLTSTARTAGSTRRSSSRRCGCRRPRPNTVPTVEPPSRRHRARGRAPVLARGRDHHGGRGRAAAVLRPHRRSAGGRRRRPRLPPRARSDSPTVWGTRAGWSTSAPVRCTPRRVGPRCWAACRGWVRAACRTTSWSGSRSAWRSWCSAAMVGRRYFNARAGLLAACLAALYPGFWLLEGNMLSEPLGLALLGVVLLLVADLRDHPTVLRAAIVGAVSGLLALTRPEQVVVVALIVVPLLLRDRSLSTLAAPGADRRRRRRDDRGPRAVVGVQRVPLRRAARPVDRRRRHDARGQLRARVVQGSAHGLHGQHVPAGPRQPASGRRHRRAGPRRPRRGGRQRPATTRTGCRSWCRHGSGGSWACSARARRSTSSPSGCAWTPT